MNASSAQSISTSHRRTFRRGLVIGLCFVVLGGAAGAGFWHVRARRELGDLERQLVLAQRNGDAGAVGEIARRIGCLDDSPSRLLAVSGSLVQVRLFDDLEDTLVKVLRLAPERGPEVVRLRARAAAAKAEWPASIALWDEYLAEAAVATPDRVTALDEVVTLLMRQGQWERARARSDSRLALADAAAARLVRAHIEVRLRQWEAAREDFSHLKITAPAEAAVKEALPGWERIERAMTELQAADETVNVVSTGLRGRLERAMVCARLGLWQNAADDLQQAAEAYPSAQMPGLFGAALGLPPSFTTLAARADGAMVGRLPWLASTRVLTGFGDRLDGQWAKWRELAALDERLTSRAADLEREAQSTADSRAARAQLICDLGMFGSALGEALAILKDQPHFVPAHRVAITALLASGELVRASGQLERALAAQAEVPNAPDPELQRLAGLVWQAQGKHLQAVEALTSCLAHSRRADLLRARARSLRQLQRFTEAAQDLGAALALEAVLAKEDAQ